MKLTTRIQRLERKQPSELPMWQIFRVFVRPAAAQEDGPQTTGVGFIKRREFTHIKRMAGETEDELMARAEEAYEADKA